MRCQRATTSCLWGAGCRARATALEKGLNTVLNPLLDAVEHLLDQGCVLDTIATEPARSGNGDVSPSNRRRSSSRSSNGDSPASARRSSSGSRHRRGLNWDTVQLRDLPGLVERACGKEDQLGSPASIQEATSGMLRVLHAICVAGECAEVCAHALIFPPWPALDGHGQGDCMAARAPHRRCMRFILIIELAAVRNSQCPCEDQHGLGQSWHVQGASVRMLPCNLPGPVQLPVPPALLEISSLNRLLALAGRIVGRHCDAEPKQAAAQRWAEWLAVAGQLGLRDCHLAVALSAPSKALMISMHMAARYGSGRVSFKVCCAPTCTHACYNACCRRLHACLCSPQGSAAELLLWPPCCCLAIYRCRIHILAQDCL